MGHHSSTLNQISDRSNEIISKVYDNGRKIDEISSVGSSALSKLDDNGRKLAEFNDKGDSALRKLNDISGTVQKISENRAILDSLSTAINNNNAEIIRNGQAIARTNAAVEQNGQAIVRANEAIQMNAQQLKRTFEEIKAFEYSVSKNAEVSSAHFIKVEAQIANVLFSVERSKVEILGRFDLAKLEILDSIRQARIQPIVSSLETLFNFFINKIKDFNSLPFRQRIADLELQDETSIMHHIQHNTSPNPGTLHALLSDIINQKFAIPEHEEDKTAIAMFELLFYTIHVYTMIIYFAMEQYRTLAEYYYHKNDFEQYNRHSEQVAKSFRDFSGTMIASETGFIDKVTSVLNSVRNLDFIHNVRTDVDEFAKDSIETLSLIKSSFAEMSKDFDPEIPPQLEIHLSYTQSLVKTPIDVWESGKKVSYAIQYVTEGANGTSPIASKVSEFSKTFVVHDLANPVVRLPSQVPPGKKRLIFRKFVGDPSQLVAVLADPSVTEFRDINRDLFNAALEDDQRIGVANLEKFIANGGDVNAVFELDKRPIHVAAENSNWLLAQKLINHGVKLDVRDEDGHSPLYIATEAGDYDFVKSLIDQGANTNVKTNAAHLELAPLHCAAYKGFKKIADVLMYANATDLNVKSSEGFTPLHFAASFGKNEIVSLLLSDHRTLVDPKSVPQMLTPLHLASISNSAQVVSALLNTTHVAVNAKALNDVTPLHLAAAYGSKDASEILIANHADIYAKTSNGSSLVHYAAFGGNIDIVSSVSKNFEELVDAQNNDNITPLYIAYQYNNLNAAAKLIDNCANVNLRVSGHKTLLHLAAENGDLIAVQNLLAKGMSVSVLDDRQRQPLHYAVANGHSQIVRKLLLAKADPNAIDATGKTPIFYLIDLNETDALSIAQLLIDYKANAKSTTRSNYTFLHLVSEKGLISIAKFLIENGADVNAKTDDNFTPLHYASANGNLYLAKFLIQKGATLDALNKNSDTPLVSAVRGEGSLSMIKFYIEKGANFKIIDSAKNTLVLSAVKKAKYDVAKFLIQKTSDYTSANNLGETPFGEACAIGNLEFVKYFQTLANVDQKNGLASAIRGKGDLELVKFLSINGTTGVKDKDLVFLAAQQNKLDVVKYLIEYGADATTAEAQHNSTPLHEAAKFGNVEMAKVLVNAGAKKNLANKTSTGITPLFDAVDYAGSFDMVKYLVEIGALVDAKDAANRNLIDVAIAANKSDIALFFIERGVSFKEPDSTGKVPLHYAAMRSNVKLAEYFLSKNATVDAKDANGKTPLLYAIESDDNIEMVKLLIAHGAKQPLDATPDKNLVNLSISHHNFNVAKFLIERGGAFDNDKFNGTTALDLLISTRNEKAIKHLLFEYKDEQEQTLLHVAVSQPELSNVRFLLERGAHVNAADKFKNTPLHSAALNGQLENVKLLVQQICVNINLKNVQGQTAFDVAKYNRKHNVAEFLSEHAKMSQTSKSQYSQTGSTSMFSDISESFVQSLKIFPSKISQFWTQSGKIESQQQQQQSAQSKVSSIPIQNIDYQGSMLLLDVFVRSKTGQKYIPTSVHSISPVDARTYSLNVVKKFEQLLSEFFKQTNVQLETFDSFKLFQSIESYMISGQYDRIESALSSIARFPNKQLSTTQFNNLHKNIDKILIETKVEKYTTVFDAQTNKNTIFAKIKFDFEPNQIDTNTKHQLN